MTIAGSLGGPSTSALTFGYGWWTGMFKVGGRIGPLVLRVLALGIALIISIALGSKSSRSERRGKEVSGRTSEERFDGCRRTSDEHLEKGCW